MLCQYAGRGVHRDYDNGKRKESFVSHGVNQLYSTLKNRNFTLKNGKNHKYGNYDPLITSLSPGGPLSLFSPGKTFAQQQPYNSLVVFDNFDNDVQCS